MTPIKVIVFALLILWIQDTNAQQLKDTTRNKSHALVLIGEMQHVHTTHHGSIFGGSIVAGKFISRSAMVGLGMELSYKDKIRTYDINFDIHSFRPIPVFADFRVLLSSGKVIPYIELAPGVAFIHYLKNEFSKGEHFVWQTGFYAYAGTGLIYKISNKISASGAIGVKGYHISSNVYEVNPHGLTYRFGVVLNLPK